MPAPMERSPLAELIANRIRSQIANGDLAAGRAIPSERALSERYGVSRTVVRAALAVLSNSGDLINRPRCRPVVPESVRSPRHRSPEGYFAVWLWPYVGDYSAAAIFRGIQQGVRDTHHRLVVGSVPAEDWDAVHAAEAEMLTEAAADPNCAGVIMWCLGDEDSRPALEQARLDGLQIVFIDRQPPRGIDGDCVSTDNLGSAQRAVKHLTDLGHRRIAFVGNLDRASTVRDRRTGYHRALEAAGISVRPEWLPPLAPTAFHNPAQAYGDVVQALMSGDEPPTAIFAVNDSVALEVIEALGKLGLSVPEDVSVVGFDGLLRWLPGGGQLTSAHQDFSRIGELAAELLIERLEGTPSRVCRHVLLEAPLVPCGSTASPRPSPVPGNVAGSLSERHP